MDATISTNDLRLMRIIIIALSIGVIIFTLIALFVNNSKTSFIGTPGDGLVPLRIAHVVVTAVVIILAKILPARILSGSVTPRTSLPGGTGFVARYRVALIVQFALLEGCVLFGLVVFMVGSEAGAVSADPSFYLHFLPLVLFLMAAKTQFPTEEKFNALARMYNAEDSAQPL
ncbi:MAG TPA: hypothetical protein VEW28_00665 [Candidatus Kapabacteria bacterium]|nr:hypothetical protein [Candidatus Kapabacteria bacterium]